MSKISFGIKERSPIKNLMKAKFFTKVVIILKGLLKIKKNTRVRKYFLMADNLRENLLTTSFMMAY